jgi:hypothetical protein
MPLPFDAVAHLFLFRITQTAVFWEKFLLVSSQLCLDVFKIAFELQFEASDCFSSDLGFQTSVFLCL